MTNQQLTVLPLNGRGFYQLPQLTPGASLQAAIGNSLAIRPEIVNGNVISGIRGSATSFLLDGGDVSQDDVSIFKDFAMPRKSVLFFRAEFFNFANTTSFSAPGASITTSAASATVDTPTSPHH